MQTMDLAELVRENQELLVVIGILAVLCVLSLLFSIRFFVVERRFRSLLKGAGSKNLEAVLLEAVQSNQAAEKHLKELDRFCEKLQGTTAKSLQKIGLFRFNAFPDMGGDLSFALALLDSRGSGVVLCYLVGRDDCRVYAKSVVEGKSSYLLSDEEKSAIKKAFGEYEA